MSELPNSWCEVTIADVTSPFAQVDPKKTPGRKFKYVDIGSIDNGSQTITNPKVIKGAEAPSRARRVIHTGDTLFSTVRTYLKNIALVSGDLDGELTSTGIAVLRPNEAVDPRYLFTWACCDKFVAEVSVAQDGTMYPAVSDRDVANAMIRVPPLPEQRRIVVKIDSLSAKSRRARGQLDHISRLVEKYKQAILAAAFRGDLTDVWRRSSRRSIMQTLERVRSERQLALPPKRRAVLANLRRPKMDLPELPHSWEWVCVEELAADDARSIQSGPFGSSLLHSEFQQAGFLVIGIDNVQDGTFSLGSQNRINEAKFRELERFRARPADVLITVMATIGRTCVVPDQIEPAIISKHIYRITVDRRFSLPAYLMNAFRGADAVLEQMGANVRGQTRPGLNGEIIKGIYIPIAPLDEQMEVLRTIETAFAWINRLASEATSARKLVDHLDQAVLAKAFRGELVPQDPNDEPASVLLDRIRAERATGSSKNAVTAKRRVGRETAKLAQTSATSKSS
jgi:type I restriction enzyme S subunit